MPIQSDWGSKKEKNKRKEGDIDFEGNLAEAGVSEEMGS